MIVSCFMQAPNKASICFKNEFEAWSSEHAVDVLTSTRDTFQEMFDNDQTLVYVDFLRSISHRSMTCYLHVLNIIVSKLHVVYDQCPADTSLKQLLPSS